jgi:hypothetical protein
VYNTLSETLPTRTDFAGKLARSAVIGFCASAVSDTCSNSIRVIKVYKQANTEAITYPEALKRVIKVLLIESIILLNCHEILKL